MSKLNTNLTATQWVEARHAKRLVPWLREQYGFTDEMIAEKSKLSVKCLHAFLATGYNSRKCSKAIHTFAASLLAEKHKDDPPVAPRNVVPFRKKSRAL